MKTLEDIRNDAGDDLAKKIIDSLRELTTSPLPDDVHYALTGNHNKGPLSDQQIVDWFYRPIRALDDQSPYELCKKGEHQIVENLLNEYDSGFAL